MIIFNISFNLKVNIEKYSKLHITNELYLIVEA